jgi:hypothetical protein
MRMRVGIVCLALAGMLCAGAPAAADPIDVPSNLLVLRAGLEWAWASPCAPVDPSCATPLEMHHGFRLAQEADWLAGFTGLQDVYNAFNPVGASQLCASGYFNSGYSHCDAANVWPPNAGYVLTVWNAPEAWGSSNTSYAESFVVRGGAASVPDPGSSLLLLGMGLVGLRAWRKRR